MIEKKEFLLNIPDIINRLQHPKSNTDTQFPLSELEIMALSSCFKDQLLTQPMLLELNPPVIVCGDIHGQFSDLLAIFDKMGGVEHRNYLFLGDYVDRGKKSLECICLLMSLKIKFPTTFFLLRGNHQSSKLNKIYGFYDQCKRKFSPKIFKAITDSFGYLPVAAVIGSRIFCVHGGISPVLVSISLLNNIKRPLQPETNPVISDLLWSDPNRVTDGWDKNFERGVSVVYGRKVIDHFLKENQFDFICRSHQVVEQGYQFFHDRSLLTIFSAPNYCGQFQNFAAVLSVSLDMTCSLTQLKGELTHFSHFQRASTPLKITEVEANKAQRVEGEGKPMDKSLRNRKITNVIGEKLKSYQSFRR